VDINQKKRAIDNLEKNVEELRRMAGNGLSTDDVDRLREDLAALKRDFYANISAWQRTQLARHPDRPYTLDYARLLLTNFNELAGDRAYGDDSAMIGGFGWFRGRPVMLIGQQKGRDTHQRLARNFGQAKPEGYRKALRLVQLAAKFRRPVLTFVDTPGAYPGIDAEERGQAEAIARNLREMMRLPVPIVVTVTGEGGSGGALAIAVGDRVLMLENSIYSVISPEGCASIMWRDATKAELAAGALRITPQDLLSLGLVDSVVPEPEGGAHLDAAATAQAAGDAIASALEEVEALPVTELLERRYQKFRRMGHFFEEVR
jgi:acetyl-CoA carboxylase carboxyl transferase subunit alpha